MKKTVDGKRIVTACMVLTGLAVFFLVTGRVFADDQVPDSRSEIKLSFAPLVKRVTPAVVNIYASRTVAKRSPFSGDPFFEQFFGNFGFFGQPRQRTRSSLGSGVIIEDRGIVVTNHHVIKNADRIRTVLADGREFDSEIILKDERSDLALLKIRADEKFPVIPIGDSENLEVGDLILAIGNPFGVGQTVTSGIVSALARSQVGVSDFGFFIQTDAAINPGNSGGALVDMSGQLVGINTAIFSRSGGSNGIGFAIPSNMTKVVLNSVKSGKNHVNRPWTGASFQSVTPDIAQSLGLSQPRGAIVVGIVEDGPADEAGIKIGDVIMKINDQTVDHPDALKYHFATIGIGRKVELLVLSRKTRKNLEITLRAAPETIPRERRVIRGESPFSGTTIMNLSPALMEELNMRGDKSGVVIVKIRPHSIAWQYRLKKFDIVRVVNEQKIMDTKQLKKLLENSRGVWQFVIERDGRLLRQIIR